MTRIRFFTRIDRKLCSVNLKDISSAIIKQKTFANTLELCVVNTYFQVKETNPQRSLLLSPAKSADVLS